MTFYLFDPKSSVIWGRMFHDTDGDSTENNGAGGYEPDIAGQVVTLLDSHGNVKATTTTDANGEYQFTGLAEGCYTIQFPTAVGNETLVEKDVGATGTDSDADQATGETIEINLGKGQTVGEIDAGYRAGQNLDGVVEGTANAELINVAYTGDPDGDMIDAGDAVLPGAGPDDDIVNAGAGNDTVLAGAGSDAVYAGAGDDSVEGGAGDDVIYGDGALSGTPGEIGIDPISGADHTLLVWDLSQVSVVNAPGNYDPFENDANGEDDVVGSTLSFNSGAAPTAVGIDDGGSRFDDGDLSQTLSQSVTLDGKFGHVGARLTPEYAYSLQSSAGDLVNIYAVELGGNDVVGFVSDAPIDTSETYTFLGRTDTHPDVSYADLATVYTDGSAPGGGDDADCPGGDDTLLGGDGNDTIFGNGGNDVIDGGAGNDLIHGDSGPTSGTGGSTGTPTGLGVTPIAGADQTLLVWDLSQVSVVNAPGNYDPFENDANGEDDVVGSTLSFNSGAAPTAVGIDDGGSRFDDGDLSQTLSQSVTLDGKFGHAGARLTPEYAYSLQSSAGDLVNIYAVELGGNDVVGFVSDAPIDTSETYTFLGRIDTHPDVSYADLATVYTDGSTPIPDDEDDDCAVGDDNLSGGEGDDTIFGDGGNDTLDGGNGNDLMYGDTGIGSGGAGPSSADDFDKVALKFADVRPGSETAGTPDSAVAGSSVIYDNVATLEDGTQVSARLILESKSDAHLKVDLANGSDGEILLNGNNNSAMEGETATFRLEFFDTVTGAPVVLDPAIVFGDLDSTSGSGAEAITVNDPSLVNVGVPADSSLNVSFDGTTLVATGTEDNTTQNDPDAQVEALFAGTSSVTFTMTARGVNSGLNFGTSDDQAFDYLSPFPSDVPGDDEMLGGAGDDTMFGERGDDTLEGGEGTDVMQGGDDDDTFVIADPDDVAGDVVIGGNGPDDTLDNDVLDLRGLGQVVIDQTADATDSGAVSGTVTVVSTGETLTFSQIETILTDPQNDGVVDGEETGEVMGVGYDDSNAPTDGGGDMITDGDDVIEGNGGDDTIDGGAGDDLIDGGADDDVIAGGDGDDTVLGGDGSDTLSGGEGADTLEGGAGDDDIAVGGQDEAAGGTGDDVFTIDPTDPATDVDVTIDGGSDGTDGNPDGPENGDEGDVLDLGDQSAPLEVTFGTDPESGVVDGLDGDATPDIAFEEIEKVVTGSGDDTIDGTDANGPINVETGAGDDSVDGGEGDDVISTGPGNDTVDAGDGSDTVDAGDGDNLIDTSSDVGVALPDDGFPGYGPVPPIPADSDPNDDRDFVTAGSGNDTIITGDDNDTIEAGDGDNVIDAGIDDDDVTTGDGSDTIVGGEGNDTITSGGGDDLIYGGLDPAVVPIDGTDIPDAPDGGSFGPDPDEDNGRDLIDAGAGNDTVFGQDDDDTIHGGDGDDVLDGGVDDDLIFGDAGDDTIIGGQGADTLFGGAGSDVFEIDDREDAFGDEIDGGTEDGDGNPATDNENDQLDLRGLGRFEIVQSDGTTPLDLNAPNDPDGNSFTGQVNFLDASGNVEGVLKFTEIEDIVPCFTPGTVIATPKGERLVEDLQVGDRIITRDNGIQEIRWLGRRDLKGRELLQAPHLKPVLVRAGSLGHNLPERDMVVSPNHRLLINNERTALYFEEREVLAAAKHLTGLEGVDAVEASGVSYIHFMFDNHEVVLSNGAWTESFQPGEQTMDGMGQPQRDEIFELFPELREAEGLNAYQSARRSLKKHEARLLVK
ncbi:Ca2+-binding RTX toxin-like protein [Roseovarius halotolerans]|uniref:Bifunctional hemolysin/adenylate cyclase n=1 Tax=Roseovarius halotolerans TaxID=505353 RepID=A0A1X6ZYD7_9RHOB|nr:Hint domain-containing protein [Roseovarius halotolerans]RKT27710.1 Ca2+-binding RTX toxin-like protein [Roseovarius halotolerans]SLN64828.1 Bifunctional hemolysin/adenylate cyclase precursor [Roseovarius halotolerans]